MRCKACDADIHDYAEDDELCEECLKTIHPDFNIPDPLKDTNVSPSDEPTDDSL